MRYLVIRVLRGLLVLFGVSVCAFVLLELAPGDFFADAQLNPRISAVTLNALRSQYALDRSVFAKYVGWLRGVMRGDWGFSLAYNTPAAPILWDRAENTLLLTVTATILA